MRKLLAITTSLLCLFGYVQSTFACQSTRPLTKMDVAFADLIIEAKIEGIKKNNYTFEVLDVVSGEFSKNSLEAMIFGGSNFRPSETVAEFLDRYELYVRVAIVTPNVSSKFCSRERREANRMWVSCLNPVLNNVAYNQKPEILSASCWGAYIYPIESYNQSRDYPDKSRLYSQRIVELQDRRWTTSALFQLQDEIIGDSKPLPWHLYPDDPENKVAVLVRQNLDWFTEGEEVFNSDKELLEFLGMDLTIRTDRSESGLLSDEVRYASKVRENNRRKIESLARVVRRVKDYIKIDPEYADRLLAID